LGIAFASKTVRQLAGKKYLGYKKRQIISVAESDSVLVALQTLDRNGITGVPGLSLFS
jgi:CBS domain-containing protein